MRLFRWGKPKPVSDGLPYGLNPEKLDHLGDLSDSRGYAIFVQLLRDIAEEKGLNLLHYKETSDFRYWQGYISALRDVQTLIPDLRARYVSERTRKSESQSGRRKPNGEPDKRSFLGSPFWDALYGPGD